MTLQEVKTESVTKIINGTGETLDIKESRVTITSENKVSRRTDRFITSKPVISEAITTPDLGD